MPGTNVAQRLGDLAPELVQLDGDGAAVLAQDPRRQQRERRVIRDEDSVVELAGVAERALDPPRGVPRELDPRLALGVPDLPRGAAAVNVDVEVRRDAEVALAPRRKANVPADARDAERADVLAVEVLSDHVPTAVVREEPVGVERPLALAVPRDRVVRKLDRPLLRDRSLELAEAARHLRRVVGVEDLDAHGGVGCGLVEAGTSEREVLQREPEGLGVRELALEQVQRSLEGRELVVVQLELVQEIVLGAERVELLAGELVALRLQRYPERDQLRPVRVEAACE